MKRIILLIILFNCNCIFSQEFEKLNLRDTIYLYFDKIEKNDNLHLKYLKYEYSEIYTYQFSDGNAIMFNVDLHKEFKKTICKKKSFIIENKNKVFYMKQFDMPSFLKIISELERKRIQIFIIDASLSKRNKIFIKPAKMMNRIPAEM